MVVIILIGLAFYWLLIETDYLRIRLYAGVICEIGACCDWRLSDNQVTKDMKEELIKRSNNGHKLKWGEFKDYMIPLCGWGYAYQFRDFAPEYKIELISEHSHYTWRTQDTGKLRDAFRVYRNPYLKVKLKV
uniref:Uncharacterized protein n=1 Tax=viral metagenome TaxID=1070528 RepID=A0A6M3LJV6_9ZZZZ